MMGGKFRQPVPPFIPWESPAGFRSVDMLPPELTRAGIAGARAVYGEVARMLEDLIADWLGRWGVDPRDSRRWSIVSIVSGPDDRGALPLAGRIREFAILKGPELESFGSRLCFRWMMEGEDLKFESWERISG